MEKRILTIILLAAALIRFGLLAVAWNTPERLITPDAQDYLELSASLAEEGAFSRDGLPEIIRTPGYPVFLLIARPFGAGGWRVVVILQIFLDLAVVALTYRLGIRLADGKAALVAAGFQAVAAVCIVASLRVLSDGLFAFLFLAAILLLIHHFQTGTWWMLLCSAALLGVACYVRAVGLAAVTICVIVLLFRPKRLARAGAFVGIVLVLLAPWILRNSVRANYVGFSSFAGDGAYHFAAPVVLCRAEGITIERARKKLTASLPSNPSAPRGFDNPSTLARQRRQRVWQVFAEYPGTFTKMHLEGSLAFWLPAAPQVLETVGWTTGQRGTRAVLLESGPGAAIQHYFQGNVVAMLWTAAMAIVLAVKYGGVGICLVGKVRGSISAAGVLAGLLVGTFALAGGLGSVPRYRLGIEPFLSVAAAVGILRCIQTVQRRKNHVRG